MEAQGRNDAAEKVVAAAHDKQQGAGSADTTLPVCAIQLMSQSSLGYPIHPLAAILRVLRITATSLRRLALAP
jgi:hypothetical protein